MPVFKNLDKPSTAFVQSNVRGMGGFVLHRHGSALFEAPGFRGVTHLGEHLFARSYMRFGDEIAKLGLSVNASTYGYKVEFHAFGLESSVQEFVEKILLHDNKYVFRHIPSREDFERERGVVVQEYEGSFSEPRAALWYNVGRKHFNYYSSIGCLEDLKQLTYDNFVEFYEENYRQFTGIAYVGDIEHGFADRHAWSDSEYWMVPGHSDLIPYMTHSSPTLPREKLPEAHYVPEFYGGSDRETFIMDWMELDCVEWERKLVQELWNCGTVDSAPLMVELRKKNGLCYAAYMDTDFRPVGIMSTYITTAPENVGRVRDLVRGVLDNVHDHITPERYQTTIDYVAKIIEKESLLNFKHGWLSRFYAQEDSVLTLDRLHSFTYERCSELMEQLRTRQWVRAEAGTKLVLG